LKNPFSMWRATYTCGELPIKGILDFSVTWVGV
jgi:hypothetical protein